MKVGGALGALLAEPDRPLEFPLGTALGATPFHDTLPPLKTLSDLRGGYGDPPRKTLKNPPRKTLKNPPRKTLKNPPRKTLKNPSRK
jgi:hypothetical protein